MPKVGGNHQAKRSEPRQLVNRWSRRRSLHAVAWIIRLLVAPALHQFGERFVAACGQRNPNCREQIAVSAFALEALAFETKGAAGVRIRRDREFDRTVECRHPDFAAEYGFIECDRQIKPQVGPIRLEQLMWRDIHRDQRVARPPTRPRPSLPFQPDLLAIGDTGRNLDLDLLARRQGDARLRTFGGLGQTDRDRGLQVLPGRRRAEVLRLELSAAAGATRTAAGGAAEHAAQKILETAAAEAAAGRALE